MHKAFDYVYIGFIWKKEKQSTVEYKKYTNNEIVTKLTSRTSH